MRLSTILPFIVEDVARRYKMTQQSASLDRAELIDHFIHDSAYISLFITNEFHKSVNGIGYVNYFCRFFESNNLGVHIQGIIRSHYFLSQQPAVLKVLGIFIISQVRGLALPFVNETSIIVGKPVKPVNRFGKKLLPEESFQ